MLVAIIIVLGDQSVEKCKLLTASSCLGSWPFLTTISLSIIFIIQCLSDKSDTLLKVLLSQNTSCCYVWTIWMGVTLSKNYMIYTYTLLHVPWSGKLVF